MEPVDQPRVDEESPPSSQTTGRARPRLRTVVLAVLAAILLTFFLIAGALDPPSRLRERPNTATPKPPPPTATIARTK